MSSYLSKWSEAEQAVLREGYACGWPTRRLVELLPGRSRNAICGQAKRLGLTKAPNAEKPTPPRKEGSARKVRERTKTSHQLSDRHVAVAKAEPPARVPKDALPKRSWSPYRSCQWPIDRHQKPGEPLRMCGAPTAPGYPYCATHCGKAYLRRTKTGTRPVTEADLTALA